MKKWNFSLGTGMSLLLSAQLFAAPLQTDPEWTYHDDYRNTPKLQLELNENFAKAQSTKDVAWQYLRKNGANYGVDKNLATLKISRVQGSLLGNHVHFAQYLDDNMVENGEIIVTVSHSSNSVIKVYNNYYPGGKSSSEKKTTISTDAAYDIAWNDLKVHGLLKAQPLSALKYVVDAKGQFKLAHITILEVAAPAGAWRHVIDAYSSEIISAEDTRIERRISKTSEKRGSFQGPTLNRQDAFKAYQATQTTDKSSGTVGRADGNGIVFDPDPRTTLKNADLKDDSPASAFEEAYFNRELLDIAFDGSKYSLEGPWIKLIDFESPSVAPSTTTDGNWTAKRGDVAFNDAMTYYIIDKSQRYMQSLGFKDDTGIQFGPIEVDANGVSGQDNSHFIPSSNRLAFGHGCVDDNEDADVILHEYGHAINYSINNNWNGGDTGAMGEGFGDYWAGSYSISTPNGRDFDTNTVFSWDGAPCWSGRILNADGARYDHSTTYGPHGSTSDGYKTDELWSTPLFQTLLVLTDQGIDRAEVDQIILEAQFGLGSGLKMRDLANATVTTAKQLYPEGPHAQAFLDKFITHHMIEVPHAVIEASEVTVLDAGDNGAIDPGETVQLNIQLSNRGTLDATALNGRISTTTEMVTFPVDATVFPDIAMGAESVNTNPFTIAVDEAFQCGDKISVKFDLDYVGGSGSSTRMIFELDTGVPQGFEDEVAVDADIPDNEATGVTSEMVVDQEGLITGEFNVDLNVSHSYIGDLKIVLTAPSGKQVTLHNKTGGGADNIVGNYPGTLASAESLSTLVGESTKGTWKLTVVDSASQDTGKIVSWGIRDVSGYECD